jgi:hypothetical protein
VPDPTDPQRPFERDAFFDEPGIVGARWWNRAFDSEIAATRRQAMKTLAGVGIVVGGIAALGVGGVWAAVANAPDKTWRKGLELQREIGWSVGAFDLPVTFAWPAPGMGSARPALARIKATMGATRYAPFQVLTRLEAVTATPTKRIPGESYVVSDLQAVVVPGKTTTMTSDFKSGETLARIFKGRPLDTMVIVDCAGMRSVAFAAGASATFEPVLVLDNWPHPCGAVAAHNTLGSLAAFEPDFFAAKNQRVATAPPILVLEHERIDPLLDATNYFDNRYFATLPSAATLKTWSFSRVLLVVEGESALPEAGDLGVAFSEYIAGGIDVRVLPLTTFGWDGSYPSGDGAFFHHFPWGTPTGSVPAPLPAKVTAWRPQGSQPLSPKTPPAHFGETQVYTRKGALVDVMGYGGSRDRSDGSGYSGG